MNVKLRPDREILTEIIRIGHVSALVLRPREGKITCAVLWIHGGGYILGMKEMVYMSRAADLVKKYGALVVSPGYRLAWQKPWPAAAEDCYAALRYLYENAGALGYPREKLMVGGESAGGGLAAAVCMMARDRGIPVCFQMPLYPMLSNMDTASSRDNHGRIWNTRRNHLGWRLYLRSDAKKPVSPYASPAQQTNFAGLPPCYSFVGEGEPFYMETLEYAEKLRAAGVPAEVDVYPTDIHAFDMLYPKLDISRRAIAAFERQFESALLGAGEGE